MNRKILALLLSLVMILCQSTMCFGEDLIDSEVYAEEAVELSSVTVPVGSDFVVSGDIWNEFSVKNATYSVEGGIAKFVADMNKKGNNEYISAAAEMPVGSYDEFTVKIKYTNVKTPTSNAVKDNGYYIPRIKLEFECLVDGGVQKNDVIVSAVTGDESQVYTTADFVEVSGKLSDIEGYDESLTATKINIYPVYGFKAGTAEIESVTVKPAENTGTEPEPPVVEPEEPDDTAALVWNFDTAAEVAQWTPSASSQVKVSHESEGYMKYVSTVTSSSGWMTTPVEFPGNKYNTIKYRAKVENYEPTCVSGVGNAPFLEMYYSCIDENGQTQVPKGGYSISRTYGANLGSDGLYNRDWTEYEIDLTKLKGWSTAQSITQLRLDVAKNASGTVYLDYIQLCYEEPVVDPEPPVVDPDDPIVDPDKPEVPVIEGEQWFEYNFNTEADVAAWAPNSKNQIATSLVDGEYMKYVSTPTTNASGNKQSGWATAKVNFDGNQYYKMIMRAKIENYERTFSGSSAPYFTIYYEGKNASGATQSAANSYSINVNYKASEDENGLFNSDWVEYEIDFANLKGWDTMSEVSNFRIDFAKNAGGTVYVDYIRFLSLPAINSLTYNDMSGADMTKVPVDAKSIEAYISQPVNKIGIDDIAIYEKSDDAEKVYVGIKDVRYTVANGKIAVTLDEEMLSDTEYVFEIKSSAMVNSKQSLYRPIAKEFRTDASSFEVEITDLGDGSALVKYVNTGAAKNIALIATAWDGTKFVGKEILPVSAENGITEELIDYSSLGGDRVEIITWEFNKGIPKVYGKKVVEIVR